MMKSTISLGVMFFLATHGQTLAAEAGDGTAAKHFNWLQQFSSTGLTLFWILFCASYWLVIHFGSPKQLAPKPRPSMCGWFGRGTFELIWNAPPRPPSTRWLRTWTWDRYIQFRNGLSVVFLIVALFCLFYFWNGAIFVERKSDTLTGLAAALVVFWMLAPPVWFFLEHFAADSDFYPGGKDRPEDGKAYGELASKFWAALIALMLLLVNGQMKDHEGKRKADEEEAKKTAGTLEDQWRKAFEAESKKADERLERLLKALPHSELGQPSKTEQEGLKAAGK